MGVESTEADVPENPALAHLLHLAESAFMFSPILLRCAGAELLFPLRPEIGCFPIYDGEKIKHILFIFS